MPLDPETRAKVLTQKFYLDLLRNADGAHHRRFLSSDELIEAFGKALEHMTPHVTELLLSNPYIRFFVRNDFIKPEELAHIPQCNTVIFMQTAIKPLTLGSISHIRKVMEHFIEYAKQDVLHAANFKILYDNLPYFFIPAEDGGENKLNETIILTFKKKVGDSNVQTRIEALLKNNPQKLLNDCPDSFETLVKTCYQFQINFEELLVSAEETIKSDKSDKSESDAKPHHFHLFNKKTRPQQIKKLRDDALQLYQELISSTKKKAAPTECKIS